MTTEPVRTKIITRLSDFRTAKTKWNELAGDQPFHRWEWMFSWWEAFRGMGDLAIIVVVDSTGQWVGIAPWFKSISKSLGRVVRSLGSGAACSDYVGLLIKPGWEQVVCQAIADELSGNRSESSVFADVDVIEIEAHAGDCVTVNTLLAAVQPTMRSHRIELAASWRTKLAPGWDEFNAQLSKSFRRKTKKAVARLNHPDFRARTVSELEEVRKAWPTFVALHQRRRERLDQAGCFADAQFEYFLRTAVGRFCQAGLTQLHLIEYQGQPFSCNLQFSSGQGVFMYQTGAEPDLMHLEPGHIVFTWAIQQAIASGDGWFDFLRGDEAYKARWNAERIPLYTTQLIPRRLKARLRHGFWATRQNVKTWAKSILNSSAS